MNLKELKRT